MLRIPLQQIQLYDKSTVEFARMMLYPSNILVFARNIKDIAHVGSLSLNATLLTPNLLSGQQCAVTKASGCASDLLDGYPSGQEARIYGPTSGSFPLRPFANICVQVVFLAISHRSGVDALRKGWVYVRNVKESQVGTNKS